MKLIDLLVKELPQRGGWPANISYIAQDEWSATWGFLHKPEMDCDDEWMDDSEAGYEIQIGYIGHADDCNTSVISKQQYEAALTASKAVVGHNGWIQWAGGECPVDSDAIVEVKFRNPSRNKFNNDRADDFYWAHTGSNADIIAYRLQQPTKSEQACDDAAEADDESDLNECIGQGVDMPEWNGEGLPPVGVKCEFTHGPYSVEAGELTGIIPKVGEVVEIVAHRLTSDNNPVAVVYWDDNGAGRSACFVAECFRPLRTEAEKLRDEAGLALYHAINWDAEGEMVSQSRMEDYKKAYDAIAAGKIPGVKLEGK